jgi:hypothetical protein
MSRIRLYVDEDAAETAIVEAIVAAGFDVVTAAQVSRHGEDDEFQLDFAAGQGRVMYTLNVADFARLHAAFLTGGREHAGIMTIPAQRYGVGEKLRRLLDFMNRTTAEEMRNRIAYL